MPADFLGLAVQGFCSKRLIFTCWHGEECGPSGLLEGEVDGAEPSIAHPHVQHQVVVPGGHEDEVLLHQGFSPVHNGNNCRDIPRHGFLHCQHGECLGHWQLQVKVSILEG